ncbi:succinate-semialdehyde dehydrogenase (NADP+) [Wickerhamomyces ciferrii]|uniref:Succinate-semialdehyde dehydrogenase n=1 Tax=Wickerhamomyces ciferrii (strain ATCC 14091 / BCRC 22168 / CBS 111 / JCM 3599 / NBRC 0793 / NRRL Y-1031 F-60-10) TaxID=1206466 RepID=K0KQT1_WICCF|nr:succinate-semialdehyde dehydrogenase (NADP+) [Wickerhamomyces ciferrii]CCH45446.1 succinate-semialdehyde dehydrogenase (NADP+) [Wickerhamomyces ciferrii]
MVTPTFKDPEIIRKGALINGEWITEGPKFDVTDPATGEVIAQLPDQSIESVDKAIDVAYDAFKTFKNTTPRQRSQWLRNLFDLMTEYNEDLGKIVSWENGKSLAEGKGEVKYGASYFEWYAEEAPRAYGHTIQPATPTNRAFTVKQPVGVCGIITPWNFPSAMITRKAGAALAAGCTVVIKPDAQTPLSALALGYLAEKAGFPKGVFNIVLSQSKTPEFGLKLCESPKIKKISFTGSTNVGKILMKQSASTLKKLSFELGGNAPLLIFKDANLENAVEQAVASKFRGLGQTCVCANRIYVQKDILDQFVTKFHERVSKFTIGHGLDEGTTHGCMINTKALSKVEEHVQDAVSKGAQIIAKGGRRTDLGETFYEPTILSQVTQDMKVAKEETFGPLAAIIPFDTPEQVVSWANDVDVGLASYVFSENYATLYSVSEALETGMVSCNTGIFTDCAIPFGGVKESGFGREGSLYGLDDYMVIKVVNLGNIPKLQV